MKLYTLYYIYKHGLDPVVHVPARALGGVVAAHVAGARDHGVPEVLKVLCIGCDMFGLCYLFIRLFVE